LDTVRLLAEETGDLVDEVWNYIKGGKLVEAAVLLLAAQGQIRGGRSSKRWQWQAKWIRSAGTLCKRSDTAG
jgi:hypothetical protein